MASASLLNRTVGNWRLERLLGEGGFGAVYAAQNVVVAGRRAAVKVLHAEMAVNAEIKRRFINEASAASRAEHENIIQVFDAGVTEDGTCYIVMELLAGRSLAETLRLGPIDPPRTVNIGLQVASALAAAHRIDIVHRDLKPDNVFLVARATVGDVVKVLDFGVAKLRGDFMEGSGTKTGTLIGTPGYMSPEQWKGASDLDGRSDIYALGLILFECLVGRLPFSGNTTYEWLYAHLNEPVPEVSSLVPSCPLALSRAITMMVAKERADRPQSMANVLELLRAAATVSPAERATVLAPSGAPIMNAATLVPERARPTPANAAAATASPSPSLSASQSPSPALSPSGSALPARALSGPQGTAFLTDEAAAAADLASLAPRPVSLQPLATPAAPVSTGAGERRARTPSPPRASSLLPIAIIAGGIALGVGGFFAFRPKSHAAPGATPNAAADPTPQRRDETPPAPPKSAPLAKAPENMIAFAAGTFTMGRDDYGNPSALDVPAHEVQVRAFALARAEVTNREFAELVATGNVPAPWKSPRELERKAALPVTGVTHEAAARYCAWKFPRGRLPTEAEWESAARGKAGRLYPWGDAFDKRCVNGLAGESGAPTEAGKHRCGDSPEGLSDLAGNVWEWTATPAAAYPGAMVSAPPGGYFVVRGGSFFNMDPNELTATARQFLAAGNRYVGFRCAADL